MAIQLLSNLNYPVGNIINQELQNAENVQIAVAFLKYSGIKMIENSLNRCLEKGGKIELIVGLDFKTTDPKSLHYFINLKKENANMKFYCFGDRDKNKTNTMFHPKIYLFENKRGTTGIVGSTNLTQGGLMTNFEVNAIFKEVKPLYFSQLQAIYNSVKFTDSIFSPDEEYLSGYSEVYKAFLKNEIQAKSNKSIQSIVKEMQQKEDILPGTVPSLKSLIIDIIKRRQQSGTEFVSLQDIYKELEKAVVKKKLTYKMDTFRNTIRGEFNKHEEGSKHPDNMRLFVRSLEHKGFYSLTERGKNYQGR